MFPYILDCPISDKTSTHSANSHEVYNREKSQTVLNIISAQHIQEQTGMLNNNSRLLNNGSRLLNNRSRLLINCLRLWSKLQLS